MLKSSYNRLLVATVLIASVALTVACTNPGSSDAAATNNTSAIAFADVPTGGSARSPLSIAQKGNAPGINVASVQAISAQHISWTSLQGAPNFKPGSGEGIWVWNENSNGQNTLHVATTTEGLRHVFTGILRTGPEGNFWDLDTSHFESDDHASQPAYNEVHFDLTTYSGVDAFNVKWSGRGLTLDFRNDGQLRPYHVYYGSNATPAHGMPLIVDAGDDGLLTLPLSALNGATGFHAGAGDSYWIYSDANGIHLRTTTKNVADHKYYTGQIFGEFSKVSLFAPDDDWLKWPSGDHADFGLHTNGGVDGVDLTLKGASIVFTLQTDGRVAAPEIALGSNGFGMVHALTFRLK